MVLGGMGESHLPQGTWAAADWDAIHKALSEAHWSLDQAEAELLEP